MKSGKDIWRGGELTLVTRRFFKISLCEWVCTHMCSIIEVGKRLISWYWKLFYSTILYLIFSLILATVTLCTDGSAYFLVLLNIYCLRLSEGWEIHKLHSLFASSFHLIGELNTAVTLAHIVYEKCDGSCQNPGLPDCLGKKDHSSTWGDQSQYPCWLDIWPEP